MNLQRSLRLIVGLSFAMLILNACDATANTPVPPTSTPVPPTATPTPPLVKPENPIGIGGYFKSIEGRAFTVALFDTEGRQATLEVEGELRWDSEGRLEVGEESTFRIQTGADPERWYQAVGAKTLDGLLVLTAKDGIYTYFAAGSLGTPVPGATLEATITGDGSWKGPATFIITGFDPMNFTATIYQDTSTYRVQRSDATPMPPAATVALKPQSGAILMGNLENEQGEGSGTISLTLSADGTSIGQLDIAVTDSAATCSNGSTGTLEFGQFSLPMPGPFLIEENSFEVGISENGRLEGKFISPTEASGSLDLIVDLDLLGSRQTCDFGTWTWSAEQKQLSRAATAAQVPSTATPVPPTVTRRPPTATPLPPTVTLTPTTTPTPDVSALVMALSSLIDGQGVPGAAEYHSDGPGPHRIVILTTEGSVDEDWNEQLPAGWFPSSVAEAELVVVVGPEREITLSSQDYLEGPDITAYRYVTDIKVRRARTGETLAAFTFRGSDPRPFPSRAPYDQTRLEGSHCAYVDLESLICPKVMRQGCWGLRSTFEALPLGISSSAFSPDGHTLATGTVEGTIILWDAASGKKQLTLKGGKPDLVMSVAFSPDGRFLAGSSFENRIALWETATGTRLHTLESGPSSFSLAFSPDGDTLAGGLFDGTIILWDVASGTKRQTLVCGSAPIASMSFSPEGHILASACGDGTATLWDTVSGTSLRTLGEDDRSVLAVAFSPDGRTLVSTGSWDEAITLWDATSGARLYGIGSGIEAYTVAFSPDGQILASSGSLDGTVILWDATTGAKLNTLGLNADSSVMSATFASDGRTLAIASDDGTVRIWQLDYVPKTPPKPTRAPVAPTPPGVPSRPTAVPGGTGQSIPFQTLTCPTQGVAITAITASGRGWWNISGTADIPHLDYWKGEISADGQEWTVLYRSSDSVRDGLLIEFNTGTVPRGTYQIRLLAVDRTGNYPEPCIVQVSTK